MPSTSVSRPSSASEVGAGRQDAPEAGAPLRILVVNWLDRQNPQSGGAETHLHEVFGRLARAGHRVTLLCSGWEGCEPRTRLDGIEVHRVGRRYTFSLHARRYWKQVFGDEAFDVIVEDLNKVPLFTPRWGDTPVVLLVHHLFGLTAFQEANPVVAAATWLLERPVPWVFRGVPTISISESTADDLELRGLERRDMTVIPNGIELERFTPPSGDTEPFEAPTLLFLGRVKRYKRVDLVLQALRRLADEGRDVRFRIAGSGDHLPVLRETAARLGLSERVVFEGFVSEERKVELLRRSWVHVLTSPKEGWGISNLEAAACGTPTVASDSPGLRESVVDGETGFLVPHGNVDVLAERIGRLLDDDELRARLGRRARVFAEGFSWDESARKVLEVLRARVAPGTAVS